jgi:hypothetical protein
LEGKPDIQPPTPNGRRREWRIQELIERWEIERGKAKGARCFAVELGSMKKLEYTFRLL